MARMKLEISILGTLY